MRRLPPLPRQTRAMTAGVSASFSVSAGRLEVIAAVDGCVLLDHLELDQRRDVVGADVVGHLDHLRADRPSEPSKTVGWALPVRYSSGFFRCLLRRAEDHLHRRHQQAGLDELLLHLGPERGEGEGHGPHERLVGAGRALRDEQVGRVGRVEVAVAVADAVVAGVVVAVFGIDVEVVAECSGPGAARGRCGEQ